ncbi:hypothetical protein FNA56_005159 [Escherichia coli]|nr:hypothetical protein [Escherichia coli]
MSFVSLFGSRAMNLSPAFIQSTQSQAVKAGCACIKVNGHHYKVSYVDSIGGFCVQSSGRSGFLEGVLGRRGVEGRIASLELMLNKNQNPIKTHNEYINKIFESTI